MVSNRHSASPNRLLFVSRRLSRPLRISGEIPIKLSATLDSLDTDFTFLLVDYGKALRVDHEGSGEGIRTLGAKQSCHGKSTARDDACYFETEKTTVTNDVEIVSRGWLDARHRESLRRSESLEPGKRYSFEWKAFGEDYVFTKGHRIAVVVAGSDATFTVPDPHQATVDVALHNSSVILPIVGKAVGID
jgi:X-Pro dipeptidyl-peptidase